MDRTRAYRIDMKNKKINRRKEQIKAYGVIINTNRINAAILGEKDGLFSKGHYGTLGHGVKTKTKNAYASYRHKGGYGKACVYSGHDMKQIVRMNQEEKEYGCKKYQFI